MHVFKFDIGEQLTTVVSISVVDTDDLHNPLMVQVIERQAVECSGGVQNYYLCRVHVPDRDIPWLMHAGREFVKFHEIELIGLEFYQEIRNNKKEEKNHEG